MVPEDLDHRVDGAAPVERSVEARRRSSIYPSFHALGDGRCGIIRETVDAVSGIRARSVNLTPAGEPEGSAVEV